MRDAQEVMSQIRRFPGVRYIALVPNVKGADRAIAAGADVVRVVMCLSESYNRRNVGLSIVESLENCRRIRELGRTHSVRCEGIPAPRRTRLAMRIYPINILMLTMRVYSFITIVSI
jgi:hydroxymethylglutaryl-CoA lyase